MKRPPLEILEQALDTPLTRGPYEDLARWLAILATCPLDATVERALWSGLCADRLGYAFVGGYHAALARLVGGTVTTRRSLCATEAGGGHPRAIATRLEERDGTLHLDGEKTFATLATVADELLVVASRGLDAEGKNRLGIVRVKPGAPGVAMVPRPEVAFAPEVPHALVRLVDVIVAREDVLPGDGYDAYLKPFRTIEDLHVLAATVGYLLGVGRASDFDREVLAELTSIAAGVLDLGARDPSAPLTHVVLAGLFVGLRRLVGSLGPAWENVSADERARWERDQPLLLVAEAARRKRTDAAWKALSPGLRASAGT